MLNGKEAFQDFASQERALSQQELDPKVGELFNRWRQVLTASDRFKENLAQRYLSGEAHMRDYQPEPETGKRLRVILDDDAGDRWIRYSIGSEGDSLMEILDVFAAGMEEVLGQQGSKRLELRRAWKTYPGDRGEGKTHISYKQTVVNRIPRIEETNTQAALDYGQNLLDGFQVSLSS